MAEREREIVGGERIERIDRRGGRKESISRSRSPSYSRSRSHSPPRHRRSYSPEPRRYEYYDRRDFYGDRREYYDREPVMYYPPPPPPDRYDRYERSERRYEGDRDREYAGYDREREGDRYREREFDRYRRASPPPRPKRQYDIIKYIILIRGNDDDRSITTCLYVGNLPYSFREEDVSQLFEECGKIRSVAVPQDRVTGRNKGFAFLAFQERAEAENAKEKFENYPVDGRRLRIDWDVGRDKKDALKPSIPQEEPRRLD